jgi:hypothetical protein
MNRQDAKNINNQKSHLFMCEVLSQDRLVLLHNHFQFFLGALGVLAVKRVSP